MRFSVSDTAEYGDYVSGPRVAEGVKATMKDVLADIQSGAFANRWIAEQESGGAEFRRLRQQDKDHQIEKVGAELRAQMPFLNPVVVEAGEAQAAATSAAKPGPAASATAGSQA
jgi:ketol-acid reductoisomerase